jgi:hypothetical protein
MLTDYSQCMTRRGTTVGTPRWLWWTFLHNRRLFEFERHPRNLNLVELLGVFWLSRPEFAENTFAATAIKCGLCTSKSDVRRKLSSLCWNGQHVTDPDMTLDFFPIGWGVIQFGKKTFMHVLDPSRWFVWKPLNAGERVVAGILA